MTVVLYLLNHMTTMTPPSSSAKAKMLNQWDMESLSYISKDAGVIKAIRGPCSRLCYVTTTIWGNAALCASA